MKDDPNTPILTNSLICSPLKGWENVLFERGSESGLKWKYWTRRRLAVVILCSNRCLKIELTARKKSVFPVSAFHRGFQKYSHVLPEDCEVLTSPAKRKQIRTKAAKACKKIQNRWASILTSPIHRRLEYKSLTREREPALLPRELSGGNEARPRDSDGNRASTPEPSVCTLDKRLSVVSINFNFSLVFNSLC